MSELYNAIQQNNTTKALQIIESGQYDPDEIDVYDYNRTILMCACRNGMSYFAIALIASGKSKPKHVDDLNRTALMYACQFSASAAAHALIASGQSQPGHVDDKNRTALMYACISLLSDVALAIIATGQSNHEHVDKYGFTALMLAKQRSMTAVVDALENYDNYIASLQQQTQSNPYDDPNYVMSIDI